MGAVVMKVVYLANHCVFVEIGFVISFLLLNRYD
jgi:hypothetical protein